jgi:hypothetical protein
MNNFDLGTKARTAPTDGQLKIIIKKHLHFYVNKEKKEHSHRIFFNANRHTPTRKQQHKYI